MPDWPDWKREIGRRLTALKLSPAREAEITEELAQHLEDRYHELVAGGMAEEEARRVALAELSDEDLLARGLRRVEHESPQESIVPGGGGGKNLLASVWQDARYGLRQLRRNLAFTLVGVFTLALGIGANVSIFSVVYDVLLKPLPYPHPEQLISVARSQPPFPADWPLPFSGPNFLDLRSQNQVFQEMGAYFWGSFSLTGQGQPEKIQGKYVTANFFKLLGVEPIVGRAFLPGEDEEGRDHEVVLSYDFWQQKYAGARDVLGKTVDLSERTYTIVGVMPRRFGYPSPEDKVWVPLVAPKTGRRDENNYPAIGRLKPGVTLTQARAEMSAIAKRLAEEYPQSNDKQGVLLVPLHERQVESIRPTLLMLLAAVGFVLLIACANVANLLLARGTLRRREMAIRTALGAGRPKLLAQLLVESLLLALLGGAAGLLVAHWSIDLLRALKPQDLPNLKEIGISLPVLWFTFGISVLTGVIFGLLPAFEVTRIQLNDALKASGTSQGAGLESGRTRNALVVAEIAISLVLLAGAGLLIRSFARFVGLDPGFDPHRLLRFSVVLPEAKYMKKDDLEQFYRLALEGIQALPGVESAAASYPTPPGGGGESDGGFYVEGHPPATPSAEPDATWHIISPGYFDTMRTPLLAGRAFTSQDTADSLPVVIISQTLARHFFPHENAIGKRLKCDIDDGKEWWQIVGVAADQAYAGFDSLYNNEIYFPVTRFALPNTFVVRTKAAPAVVAPEIRTAIWSIDKSLPIVGLQTMEQALNEAYAPRRFDMALLLAFALLAAALAAIGVYGVMSYSVAQRTREIGIRLALGARKREVLWLVVGQGMKLALLGLVAGIAGASALTRFLSSLLYGVKPTDPLTFTAVSLGLICVALIACYIPARRATRVDPLAALRYE
jgi:putative ABC transport system permease protein